MDDAVHTRTVGILIFDDVEVLDFCGPFEVFSSARPMSEERSDQDRLFRVFIVAEERSLVRCRGGLMVQPHYAIDDNPTFDILVVPGGQGTRRERHNSRLLQWIAAQEQENELTTSVCTGSFLLGALGLLNERKATTHWASIERMRDDFPQVNILSDARVVDEGHIVTSAGISAGIDMALHIVRRLHGTDVAVSTARHMEYDWTAREDVVVV